MSQTSDASQIKDTSAEKVKTQSTSKEASTAVLDVKPITTVPPTDSKKKKST
ncbi:hypothetical protein A2U01_0090924, partial [Trifolium medium]|nr:hypothetical protein [Trifolium medium]